MTLHKKKKAVRLRGHKTHGWGAKKKRRGTGHRGGKGHAGSGKRADSKVPLMRKLGWQMGKEGFIKKNKKIVNACSIRWIDEKIHTLVSQKKATGGKDGFTVDLSALGFQKLVGTGKANHKYSITVDKASPSAVEKIEAAGGKVTVLVQDQKEDSESEAEAQ